MFRGTGDRLKYEFRVRAGGKPSNIRLAYNGARSLSVNADGDLLIATALGIFTDARPVSFQEINGERLPVDSQFVVVEEEGSYGFAIGAYDANRPLVIDPGLDYSTLLGGASNDQGRGITIDSSGNAIVTGLTASANFPTSVGAYDASLGGSQDAFVAMLDPTGSTLVFSTYLGGSGMDAGLAVALDSSGNIFITGATASPDFPTTFGALDTSLAGPNDVFVTKLSSGGSVLASTYLGGAGSDEGFGVVVDLGGNPILTGQASSGFPTSSGAYDPAANGGLDAFVTKISGTLSALIFSTFLGGADTDVANGIALDASGNPIVTGRTNSALFPTTVGAYDTVYGGAQDAFVAKFDAAGSVLLFSTFLGGSGLEDGHAIAIDATGNPIVTGDTGSSTDFPSTPGAYDTTYNGGGFDAFVTKLDPNGSSLVYSTLLGGGSSDQAFGIAVDSTGRAVITGTTSSGWPPRDVRRQRPRLRLAGARADRLPGSRQRLADSR